MCYRCYQNTSKVNLLVQLKNASLLKDYSKWNKTTLHNLILIKDDISNTKEVRNVAEDLLDEYKKWCLNKQ
jgi:hypothetical protein